MLPLVRTDDACGLASVHLGHLHVHEHDVERLAGRERDGDPAVVRAGDLVPGALEHDGRELAVHGVVIGHEHAERSRLARLGAGTDALGLGRATWRSASIESRRVDDVAGLLRRAMRSEASSGSVFPPMTQSESTFTPAAASPLAASTVAPGAEIVEDDESYAAPASLAVCSAESAEATSGTAVGAKRHCSRSCARTSRLVAHGSTSRTRVPLGLRGATETASAPIGSEAVNENVLPRPAACW